MGMASGGTSRGGPTLMGEEGTELVDLPRGSYVYDAVTTLRIMQQALATMQAIGRANVPLMQPAMAYPAMAPATPGQTTFTNYGGISLYGVQDAPDLLAQLQGMMK
jgi:hypothetical protein